MLGNSFQAIKKSGQVNRAAELQESIEGRTRVLFAKTIDLTTAKDQYIPEEINFQFRAFWVASTTDASVSVSMVPNSRAEGQLNPPMSIGQNLFLRLPRQASGAQLFWSAQAGKSITIYFFVDAEVAPGSLVTNLSGAVSVTEGSALSSALLGAASNVASVTVTSATPIVIAAADSSRKNLNLYTSQDIWVGDASVASGTRGVYVPQGFFEWKATSILYAIAVSASATVTGNDTR